MFFKCYGFIKNANPLTIFNFKHGSRELQTLAINDMQPHFSPFENESCIYPGFYFEGLVSDRSLHRHWLQDAQIILHLSLTVTVFLPICCSYLIQLMSYICGKKKYFCVLFFNPTNDDDDQYCNRCHNSQGHIQPPISVHIFLLLKYFLI